MRVYPPQKRDTSQKVHPSIHLHAHAGSHSEGGGDGGKNGYQNIQDFAPSIFAHSLNSFSLCFCTTEDTEFHRVFNFSNCHPERSEDGLLRTLSEKSR